MNRPSAITKRRAWSTRSRRRLDLLPNEWAAADALDGRAFDRIGYVCSGPRISAVQVHGEVEVAGFVFLDAHTANPGLLQEPRGMPALDLGDFLFAGHDMELSSISNQCHLQRREDVADVVSDRVRAGAGEEQAHGLVSAALQDERPGVARGAEGVPAGADHNDCS